MNFLRNRGWYGATIQVRRGTKAQLDGITLAAGELGFTTDDQKELWVGDGASNLLVGRVIMDTIGNIPSAAVAGRMFYATDTDELFVDNGATWDEILSDISGTEDNLISIDANGKPQDAGVAVDDAGTTTADLWTASKIQTAINQAIGGTSWKDPVDSINLIGNATIATLNGLSPSAGDCYVATDAGTPTAGTSDALVAGSLTEFDGTSWKELVAGSGGFVPSGTRCALSTATALIAPYTDATDDGKIVSFNGTSNTGSDTSEASDGNAVMVKEGVYDNNQYSFQGTVPTGSWTLINQGGGLSAGNGIQIASNIISVVPDSTTGGNVIPVDVTANGVGLDVDDLDGIGLEVDSATLRLATQGNGISGGAGSTLSVASDTATGATVAGVSVTANGVGVAIDNSSIVHDDGSPDVISVGTVDGGSFA